MNRERLLRALEQLQAADEFLAAELAARVQLERRAGSGDAEAQRQLAELDRREPKGIGK